MIDQCQIQRILDDLPWPDGTKPRFKSAVASDGMFLVLLHEPHCRGWTDRARVAQDVPERALRFALERWMFEKKLTDRPEFFDALKRLQN